MTWEDPLRADDFGPVGPGESRDDDPMRLAGDLVSSVDWSRVGNPAESGYVARLAGRLADDPGDAPGASTLLDASTDDAARAVDEEGPREAEKARKLFEHGREDEAMAVLRELRPRLGRDPDAAYYLTDVLTAVGRPEQAMQWLTGALTRVFDFGSDDVDDAEVLVAATLLQRRYDLRRELDLPYDDYDGYAEDLATAGDDMSLDDDPFLDDDFLDDDFPDDDRADERPVVPFWPLTEFEALLSRWPELAAEEGNDWGEHRRTVERALVALSEAGDAGIGLVAGSVAGLVSMAEFVGKPATDNEVLADYRDELIQLSQAAPWPPGRNETCWCGSGFKYKRCCLPRSRG